MFDVIITYELKYYIMKYNYTKLLIELAKVAIAFFAGSQL